MILALHVKDNNNAQWLLIEDGNIEFSHDFSMGVGEDKTLASLDDILKENKLALADIKGMVLAIREASLTQVKLYTATINALGWQHSLPVIGEFYFTGEFDVLLPKLLDRLAQQSKFEQLKVKYQRGPDITISKKQPKYKISQ
ncbi:hypothetical protein HOB10_03895 [Candidatus Parcubacteria bacterium]|jgi:hypothetical protein|nr:hypothetical protein [Candidatus Parcubacteria bacterium]